MIFDFVSEIISNAFVVTMQNSRLTYWRFKTLHAKVPKMQHVKLFLTFFIKNSIEHLFQDVNISELMKKLDILGDNGVMIFNFKCNTSFIVVFKQLGFFSTAQNNT